MTAQEYFDMTPIRRSAFGFEIFKSYREAVTYADRCRKIRLVVKVENDFHVVPPFIADELVPLGYPILY